MRSRAAVATGLLLLSTGVGYGQEQSSASDAVAKIDVQSGDQWIYRSMNDITGQIISTNSYVVTETSPAAITALLTIDGGPARQSSVPLQFTPNWGFIKAVGWTYNRPDMSNAPPLPFSVGSKWKGAISATNTTTGVTFRVNSTSAVVGREQVTLPSGDSYDAFKIVADTLATAANGTKTKTHVVLWYDPSVNRYVKRTVETRVAGMLQSDQEEYLVSYTRKADQ